MFTALRTAARARVTLTLVCAGLSMLIIASALPRAARADNTDTNITDAMLQVHLAFPDKDTQNMIELPIPSSQLPQQVQQQLNTPLGTQFDNQWSNTVVNSNNETMQQLSCDQIKQGIQQSINSSKYSAYDIDCNLASSGTLTGDVTRGHAPLTDPKQPWNVSSGYDPQTLALDYHLANNTITFSSTTPFTCHDGSLTCPADPRVAVTLDLDIHIDLSFDSRPCYSTSVAYVTVSNAQLQPANGTANILLGAIDVLNGFLDGLHAIGMIPPASVGDPQAEAASYDNFFQYIPVPLNNLGTLLTANCQTAAKQGFDDMSMRIDGGGSALTLLFTHPPIGAPTLINPNAPCTPCLIQNNTPAITVSPQQAHPGDTLTVYGGGFNFQSSSSLAFEWSHDPNTSAPIGTSDVRWGPQNGSQQTATVKTDLYDEGTFTTPNTLQPGTAYQFSVRDCDQITCSTWSSPLTLTTAAAGSNQATLRLDDPNTGAQLGTLTVQPDGTLSGTVNLPGNITPGQHTLYAIYAIQTQAISGPRKGGNNGIVGNLPLPGSDSGYPSATFTIVQASATLQPAIQALDSKGQPLTIALCGNTIILHGDHFAPGGQVTITFSAYKRQGTLNNATVKSSGSFDIQLTLPNNLTECFSGGTVTLTATETIGNGTLQATTQLNFPGAPR